MIKEDLDRGLESLARDLKMEIKVHYQESNRLTNIAILISNEDHCVLKILESYHKKELKAKIPIIIGNSNELKPIADEYNIPFYLIEDKDQIEAERQILKLFEELQHRYGNSCEIYENSYPEFRLEISK